MAVAATRSTAIVLGLTTALASATVRTPFGLVHEDCVLRLPSASGVREVAGVGVELTFPNGTTVMREPCTAAPSADYQAYSARRRAAIVGTPPTRALEACSAAEPDCWEGCVGVVAWVPLCPPLLLRRGARRRSVGDSSFHAFRGLRAL